MAIDLERHGSDAQIITNPDFTDLGDNAYECRILICPEPDGGYSVHAIRLPGVVSEGETIDEAIANIEDAFRATAQSYLDDSGVIPWADVDIDRPKNSLERWILVNV
jgi:antitoxin HicB